MDKFIKTFMAVYETRNFSLAAKQLFISQPSVSVKIHQLEEQLGVVLFERNGHRQVRPTTAATHFYKTAEQLLQTWQQGTQEVQQLAAHPRKKRYLGFLTDDLGGIVTRNYSFAFGRLKVFNYDPYYELRSNFTSSD
ncbi:LysR family transcriptional regulator [Secundilactobacillus odoratitofui]|uniref:LysR family transcriptional regulator n=1 Tax=Secundilactobacillus odoratitofui TaxID=480930 RepID=UPI0006D2572E|nr:LysR family transcriptional regulator [Secundilactobacillus odoratitofui]